MQTNHNNGSDRSQYLINVPAERSVLGALIENGSLFPDVVDAGLRVKDFGLSDHQRVFDAMLTLHLQGSPIDYISVYERLGNQPADYVLLGSLIQGVIIDEDHILYHVAIVRRKAGLRALLSIAEWITKVVDDTADPDALIEQSIGMLEKASPSEVMA